MQESNQTPAAPAVTDDTPIGPDIDLDNEVVLLADGTRLTNEMVPALVEEIRQKTAASTPRRRALTAGERELPTAVRELLDIPHPADWAGHQGCADTLTSRVYQLIGALRGVEDPADGCSLNVYIKTVQALAAEPLRYVPESQQEAAERQAAYEAKYGTADGAR